MIIFFDLLLNIRKYLRFYLDPKKKEYISKITNESVEIGYNAYYGMGMEIIKNDFYTIYEHSGETISFLCNLVVYPELDLGFFIITNSLDHLCSSSTMNLFTSVENLIIYGSLNAIYGSSFFFTYFTADIIVLFIISLPLTYLIITIVRQIKRKKYIWFVGVKGKILFGVDIILLFILPILLIIFFYVEPKCFYRFVKEILFCLFMICSCLIFNFLLKFKYVFVFNKCLDDNKEFETVNSKEKIDLDLLEDD